MIQKSITRYLGGLIACNKFDANTLTRREGIAINLIGTNITYKRGARLISPLARKSSALALMTNEFPRSIDLNEIQYIKFLNTLS
jgi:hypothetical protein